MDGTGVLFEPFIRELPQSYRHRVVAYPADRPRGYAQLLELIAGEVEDSRATILIAESFSGPLALWHAVAHPEKVRAVVLCASFVRRPPLAWLYWLAWPAFLRIGIRASLVRFALLDRPCPEALVQMVVDAVRQIGPQVLVCRLKQLWELDCTETLRACPAPVLYLRAEQDCLIGRSCAQVVQRIRPDAEVRAIPGPHLLLQAAPAAAWREIRAFLMAKGVY